MPLNAAHIPAIVLAGGRNQLPLADGTIPAYTAQLPVADRPALALTLEALRATPGIGAITVIGPAELQPLLPDGVTLVPGHDTLIDDLYRGLAHNRTAPSVLAVTADLPLLTPDCVRQFLAANADHPASPDEPSFSLAVVPRVQVEAAYPGLPYESNRFRDIAICHGSMMLVTPCLLDHPAAMRRINALYHARNPLKSALAVGLHLGLGYVLGVHLWHLLTMREMAGMASKRFGVALIPVTIPFPEATLHLGDAARYECAQRQLAARRTPRTAPPSALPQAAGSSD